DQPPRRSLTVTTKLGVDPLGSLPRSKGRTPPSRRGLKGRGPSAAKRLVRGSRIGGLAWVRGRTRILGGGIWDLDRVGRARVVGLSGGVRRAGGGGVLAWRG